jgi:hypothetical protein
MSHTRDSQERAITSGKCALTLPRDSVDVNDGDYKPPPPTEADMKFLRDLAAHYPSLWTSIVNFIVRTEFERASM